MLLAQCVEPKSGPPKTSLNSGKIRGRSDATATRSSVQYGDVTATLTRPPRTWTSGRLTSQISITDMLHFRDPTGISETNTGDTDTDGDD
ncbi:hypothetical protein DPMN_119645 [Dreissena polymorpha]|uniref:Uncharacterized protein n=1 Tax=Dreissena polymorpha TaxID=45954 RepID=A0A9D4GIJ2_DREPO|nr:hypothetical protein DPMN_119645 [Dreissena polymorpha]